MTLTLFMLFIGSGWILLSLVIGQMDCLGPTMDLMYCAQDDHRRPTITIIITIIIN
jgi:hypothetical protein